MENQHYIVLGLGISGRSVANALLLRGAKVTAYDRNADKLLEDPSVKSLIQNGLDLHPDNKGIVSSTSYNAVILSPGIPLSHPICKEAAEKGIDIVGEIEFACRKLKGKFIGVTGTNGKTTVTSQIAHTLNANGISAIAMGNNGIPLSNLLVEGHTTDVVVIELSSYQLETLSTQVLDAAVILNITPDHLDRYPSMKVYAEAKACIGLCLKPGKPLFISESIAEEYSDLFKQKGLDFQVFDTQKHRRHFQNPPPAFHDYQNLSAVYSVCSLWGLSYSDVEQALKTFRKGPHRIEFITSIRGVDFYDDSKGTNVDAVIKALAAIPNPVILIAGGVAKGAEFTCWKKPFSGKVKAICAIGDAAKQLQLEIGDTSPVTIYKTMNEAVVAALGLAEQGDAIVLSPGCASFDMFHDYTHRGQVFQDCVKQLVVQGEEKRQ